MGGLGKPTPVNRVAPVILMRFVIGCPLTRKGANVLSKLSAVKTGVIDPDSRKGNGYHITQLVHTPLDSVDDLHEGDDTISREVPE